MDMLNNFLLSSSDSKVQPETLETLGRRASQLFQNDGIPLNDAVRQVAAEMPELGNEHIKRIVEFANTVTFQNLFEKSEDKNIHFDIADPGAVIRDLKDGGSPAHDGKTLHGGNGDYQTPPAKADDGLNGHLENLFQGDQGNSSAQDGVEKVASVELDPFSRINPVDEVYDNHLRLNGARDRLSDAYYEFDSLVKQAQDDIYEIVKYEVLAEDGAGISAVASAFEKLASPELAQATLLPIIEKLAEDARTSAHIKAAFSKIAGSGVFLNPEHPLVQAISGLVKAAEEQVKAGMALKEINQSLEMTTQFLKEAGVSRQLLRK